MLILMNSKWLLCCTRLYDGDSTCVLLRGKRQNNWNSDSGVAILPIHDAVYNSYNKTHGYSLQLNRNRILSMLKKVRSWKYVNSFLKYKIVLVIFRFNSFNCHCFLIPLFEDSNLPTTMIIIIFKDIFGLSMKP